METRKTSDTRTRFKSEILAVCEELAAHTVAAMEAGEWPLVIGGDHSIAMGTVSGIASHLKKSNQKLGLIWFDAHGDMNLPESTPSGNIHGMPLAHLLGYGDKDLASIHGIGECRSDRHPRYRPEGARLHQCIRRQGLLDA
jgi:arginase